MRIKNYCSHYRPQTYHTSTAKVLFNTIIFFDFLSLSMTKNTPSFPRRRETILSAGFLTRMATSAPCHINSWSNINWIEQNLIPKLPTTSVVVMDNTTFQKDKAMQEQLVQAGFTLEYLPPYSPDLNPIEHKWAQAKSIRRKNNCSIDALFQIHC